MHLLRRVIAHTNRADEPFLAELLHSPRGFLDRDGQIRPVNLIDVDVVRAQATERILDFLPDSFTRGVSRHRTIVPLESYFGRDEDLFPMAPLLNCLSDDFFRNPETINRCRVDQVDSVVKGGMNRSNRFSLVRASPHPAADRPCTECNSRGR